MAKARVTLLDSGPVSYEVGPHKFAKGESRIITNPSDILYFQRQRDFGVEMLEGEPSAATKLDRPKAELKAVSSSKKSKKAPVEEPVVEETTDGKPTAEQLDELTLKALLQLFDEMGYEAPEEGTSKEDLIKMILAAQEAEEEG